MRDRSRMNRERPDGAIQPRPARTEKGAAAAVCLGLALPVFAVYGRTAGFGFVNFDDDHNVYENSAVLRGWTPANLARAFTLVLVSNWIPLAEGASRRRASGRRSGARTGATDR